jgi:hypothetical protein
MGSVAGLPVQRSWASAPACSLRAASRALSKSPCRVCSDISYPPWTTGGLRGGFAPPAAAQLDLAARTPTATTPPSRPLTTHRPRRWSPRYAERRARLELRGYSVPVAGQKRPSLGPAHWRPPLFGPAAAVTRQRWSLREGRIITQTGGPTQDFLSGARQVGAGSWPENAGISGAPQPGRSRLETHAAPGAPAFPLPLVVHTPAEDARIEGAL